MKNKYKIQENQFLDKINSMFILMNNISNINSESYIKFKMKRYAFVGETFGLSIESVRKIFQNTFIIKQEIFRRGKQRFVIDYQTYSYEHFLKNEKLKVIKKIKIYEGGGWNKRNIQKLNVWDYESGIFFVIFMVIKVLIKHTQQFFKIDNFILKRL